jgi:hypothetical protein
MKDAARDAKANATAPCGCKPAVKCEHR